MKDRLLEVREHYMERYMGSPVAVDFELTFEEFLLLMLEGAEAANAALMELSGMDDFFQSLTPTPLEDFEDKWVNSRNFDSEEWRNDNV